MAFTRQHLESLPRPQLRKIAQERGLGGTWTASATKGDFVESLLEGKRTLQMRRVNERGQPLDGSALPETRGDDGATGGDTEETGADDGDTEAETETEGADDDGEQGEDGDAEGGDTEASQSDAGEQGEAEADGDAPSDDLTAALARFVKQQQERQPLDEVTVRAIAKQEADAAARRIEGGGITVTLPETGETRRIEGRTHRDFADILESVAVNRKALLLGPAGCGKTTLAEQIAAALDRPFFFLSCTAGMSEAQLLGRVLLDGTFQGTPLLDAIEQGGVMLLDEADALDPNVALAMNAGIESGRFSVPNRSEAPVAVAAEGFALMMAGNDVTGGSMLYSGRAQQDAALLDRFAGCTFELSPDPRLEKALASAHGDDAAWLADFVKALRANVKRHGMRRVVSQRMILNAGRLIAANPDRWAKDREAVAARLLAGWTSEEVAKALDGEKIAAALGKGA